jgi:hypothetical protein
MRQLCFVLVDTTSAVQVRAVRHGDQMLYEFGKAHSLSGFLQSKGSVPLNISGQQLMNSKDQRSTSSAVSSARPVPVGDLVVFGRITEEKRGIREIGTFSVGLKIRHYDRALVNVARVGLFEEASGVRCVLRISVAQTSVYEAQQED